MIDSLTSDLLKLLCKEGIERDTRACGFVERRSPITGTAFLLSMMTGGPLVRGIQGSAHSDPWPPGSRGPRLAPVHEAAPPGAKRCGTHLYGWTHPEDQEC